MRRALFLLAALGCRQASTPAPAIAEAGATLSAAAQADASAPAAPVVLACSSPQTIARAESLTGLPRGEGWSVVSTSANACATAESNLRASAKAILEAPKDPGTAPHAPWDHKATPADFDRVAERLALTQSEKDAVYKNGFAVLERMPSASYTDALHDVFRRELPIYVSIDAVLHAVFESNDNLIADLEEAKLAPMLGDALAKMHGALKAAAPEYPPEVAADVDLYLAVARSLFADAPVAPVLGAQPQIAELVKQAKEGKGMPEVTLFGRPRVIDFSQYGPRGHYDKRTTLRKFFRAAMWCSRLELNLVSRSSRSSQPGAAPNPSETPREDLVALALADLAARSKADAKLASFDKAWGLLAGPREDVSVAELAKLRGAAGITDLRAPDAAEKLRKQIGAQYARTLNFHYMPQGSDVLPAIATLLGPRVVPDAKVAMHFVDPAVPERHSVTGSDFAYALGHDRAKAHLASDLSMFPTLSAELDKARAEAEKPLACTDLYSAWFGAVRGLADPPSGITPSFMSTDAFRDLRVGEAITGVGQLRHNYVLIAAQTYDEAGCQIPDGWVDPAITTYDALITYAARGAEASKELGAGVFQGAAYWERLGTILSILRRIAEDELAGRALSESEKRFLSMVVEMLPGSTGGPPTYTGWYLELFRTLEEALDGASFVADVFTSSHSGEIDYLGARGPELGVFVVDAGGAPRAFVGPVARGYEHRGTVNEKRLTDSAAAKLTSVSAPWRASYTVPAPAKVALEAQLTFTGDYSVHTKEPQKGLVLEALDHHGAVVASVTLDTTTTTKIGHLKGKNIEGLRVRVGDFTAFAPQPGVMDESASIDTMH